MECSAAELILSKTLARHIRRRREELHKSQEQVALDAGIDRNHYQVIESGRSDRRSNNPLNPQLFTLVKIANALEWSAIDLLAEPLAYYQAASAGNTSTAVPTLPARRQTPR